MRNKTPTPAPERTPLPDFTPVPRKRARHDGWTPERQRAFIRALAETGSVTTAARMVNMAHATAYALRHHPDAAEFRRAWDAALSCGVQRLRDEAFDRAMNGQLVPLMHQGKVVGFRRVKNDRLLMYLLRHYGQDAAGRRVTLNYFAAPHTVEGGTLTRAISAPATQTGDPTLSAPAKRGRGTAGAKAPVVEGASPHPARLADPDPAALIAGFTGIALDDEAQTAIVAALEACAARRRDLAPEDDPDLPFMWPDEVADPLFTGEYEFRPAEPPEPPEGECPWETLADPDRDAEIEAAVAAVRRAKESGEWDKLPTTPPPRFSRPVPDGDYSPDWRDYRAADETE